MPLKVDLAYEFLAKRRTLRMRAGRCVSGSCLAARAGSDVRPAALYA
jgi:hypothetical protein